MYPHRIRLRGPWECEPLLRKGENAAQSLPPPCRMTMPCRWSEGGLAGFNGRVRFRRSFGYPGRIDAHERVWLTFAGVGGDADAQLNTHSLGHLDSAGEFEVTRLLETRNELVVEIDGTAEQGGLWGEVALEVRCTAFLRDLRLFAILNGGRLELQVCGQVVGEAERPLELYVLLDRSVVSYQVTAATAEGQPFEMIVTDLPETSWRGWQERFHALPVQVDLVNGAVVWYSQSILVPTVPGGTERRSDQGS